MLIGHLAPVGPIAVAAERCWRRDWPRRARALPWAAALAGSVFPDLDIIGNVLFDGNVWHTFLLPHSLLPYLPVLFAGWLLSRRERTRPAGLTLVVFGWGVVLHLLLDAISHGVRLFYPLWSGVVGWPYTKIPGTSIPVAYLHSPNVLPEVVLLVAAAAWWLRRIVTLYSSKGAALSGASLRSATPVTGAIEAQSKGGVLNGILRHVSRGVLKGISRHASRGVRLSSPRGAGWSTASTVWGRMSRAGGPR